jgi:glc operon protein GlcG
MLTEHRLSLEEAQRALDAAVAEARRDGKAMAVAVTDNHGDLICCLRMDGVAARVLRHAIRKAYTAAVMARDTLAFRADLEERHGALDQWGDPQLTTLQGGVAIKAEGELVGAVAVGGNSSQRDEEIARIAAKALGV